MHYYADKDFRKIPFIDRGCSHYIYYTYSLLVGYCTKKKKYNNKVRSKLNND